MSEKIIVIGKSGQLAWELSQLDSLSTFSFFGRNDIDITCANSIYETLSPIDADAIINASAYTAVDNAESDLAGAKGLNYTAVKNLVDYCKGKNIHFTHISTDYVFDGKKGSPYETTDEYGPQSVYGKTKMEGEEYITSCYPNNSAIIRTSWVYSYYGNNFVKTMLRLMNERESLNIVCDQIGTPTNAASLAKYCEMVATKQSAGISHFSDLGVCSWYDFAVMICSYGKELGLIKSDTELLPINSSHFPTPAKRPTYSVLNKDYEQKSDYMKCANHWTVSLREVLHKLSLK